jgi:hypothetical protein
MEPAWIEPATACLQSVSPVGSDRRELQVLRQLRACGPQVPCIELRANCRRYAAITAHLPFPDRGFAKRPHPALSTALVLTRGAE